MERPKLPQWFLNRLSSISAKRPRAVIDHIMERGYVTTEELATKYGYRHPPRGARDVREQGIPLETFFLKDSKGRRMAAYRFPDLLESRPESLRGRRLISKKFKDSLYKDQQGRCRICLQPFEKRYLQVDHRVPYQVAGDAPADEPCREEYILLCASCNRAKSWSCEHCRNWTTEKSVTVCRSCYWSTPESYAHVATVEMKRLDIAWTGDDIRDYERLKAEAETARLPLPDYVRALLRQSANKPFGPAR